MTKQPETPYTEELESMHIFCRRQEAEREDQLGWLPVCNL